VPWLDEPIRTARLTLRPFTPEDREAIVALLTDDVVRRYLGGALPREQAEALVSGGPIGERWGEFCCELTSAGTIVRTVSFEVDRRHQLELSYELLLAFHGHGYAREAATAAVAWAWASTQHPTIFAVTHVANARSRHLLHHLGFVEVDRFDEFGSPQVTYRLHRGER
jgi:RimJ/RimL family protein N-acetyltransferase